MSTTLDSRVGEELPSTTGMSDDQWVDLLRRLSRLSVEKNYDPYVDIDWDAPEMRIEPHDERFILAYGEPLADTAWYRSLPTSTQADIGLHIIAAKAKMGLQFENVLKRGLLAFAFDLPNDDPVFRYVYHEVVEEANHGMMFQEFVNRSGANPKGMVWWQRIASGRIVHLARLRPVLFFYFVLGGEDPIDWVQRDALRHGGLHPLAERVARIHTTEEARHVSFARQYLKREVPKLGATRRFALSIIVPFLLHRMNTMMVLLPGEVVRRHRIPADVRREVGSMRHPVTRRRAHSALAKMHRLCQDTGLFNPVSRRLWKALDIWPDAATSG